VQPRARFLDEDGQPLDDLITCTVKYTLRDLSTGTLKINRATALVPNQATYPGEAYYQFVSADVDTPGKYAEEWEVTHSDGTKETFPAVGVVYVDILPDYDNV
jgi:hypothetical protein